MTIIFLVWLPSTHVGIRQDDRVRRLGAGPTHRLGRGIFLLAGGLRGHWRRRLSMAGCTHARTHCKSNRDFLIHPFSKLLSDNQTRGTFVIVLVGVQYM